ncbi:galactitol-1-phosphate 5-dehydrogenase [Clostridium sp. YIM B02505]|uniref:Galactitol-1-phosphate 5-dehydrogenase n=1 Tax=Clostridium yunnanense TaxID=2800325 RepID=A0ABS1EW89_9CLOT|nr:galactitol-1-phosphate 5-dehydrogenase [Clostridium yunnanense]MBK1813646.1 galactitol-1-phosphate 5-dehydrogenase [Clostridium yunnanense]
MNGKMKAAVIHGIGDIRFEMIDIPKIGENDVLVKVKYAGICGSDLPRAMVSGARKYPLVLGHEFCGEIAEIGTAVNGFKVGDRVAVAPLIPCGQCEYCKAGNYGLCEDYNIIGTGSDGAFAEYTKVPKEHILKISDELDFETAAGIEPATIGYHGLEKAEIKPGDTVVVMGCGPIGQFTIQWAKIFGASKIIAVDIFAEKLELSKQLGADITVNSKECDAVQTILELTKGGADVVAETAGSKFTQEQAILVAKKKGRIVFLGISHSDLPLKENGIEKVLRGEIKIQGSWNSYTSPYPGKAWHATIDFMAKGQIQFKPMISHKIGVEEVGQYLSDMANRKIYFNKVLVQF